MPYCPNCGEEVDEGAEFCGNCGASIKGGGSKSKGGKTSLDMEENLAGALCYVFGWVTGIIFFIMEKRSDFVRFHAMQSIITFFPLMIIAAFFSMFWWIFWGLSWIIMALTFILWIILILKAYQGERFKLPVIGDIAEEQI